MPQKFTTFSPTKKNLFFYKLVLQGQYILDLIKQEQ